EIILGCTDGRTNSSRELYYDEAKELINKLSTYDPRESHITAIKRLAFDAGIVYGNTATDWKINIAILNRFLMDRGCVKKELNKINLDELVKVHRQFEAIVNNNRISRDNKMAKTKTEQLLNELHLSVK